MHLVWISSLVGLLLSLVGKCMADAWLTSRVSVIGEFAGLQLSHNPGIAFGIQLLGAFQTPIIIVALALIVFAARKAETQLSQIGFGVIIGGAAGNVLDRLRDGFVTDFFQVGSFPIFNVADSCITIGVVLLAYDALIAKRS